MTIAGNLINKIKITIQIKFYKPLPYNKYNSFPECDNNFIHCLNLITEN